MKFQLSIEPMDTREDGLPTAYRVEARNGLFCFASAVVTSEYLRNFLDWCWTQYQRALHDKEKP